MTVRIPLSSGEFATVDDVDADWLLSRMWHVAKRSGRKYATANIWSGGKGKTVYMHRLIAGAVPGQVVDHIDGDGLNNTRANLRICSTKENSRNRSHSGRGESGFLGVYRVGKTRARSPNQWFGCVKVDGKPIRTTVFPTPEEAARKRDELAMLHHGEFAALNFPGLKAGLGESVR